MPNPRMKQRRVVHKSTAGILKPIPEAVDLVGNPPPRLDNEHSRSAPATRHCEPCYKVGETRYGFGIR
jgi:hypothetical protein